MPRYLTIFELFFLFSGSSPAEKIQLLPSNPRQNCPNCSTSISKVQVQNHNNVVKKDSSIQTEENDENSQESHELNDATTQTKTQWLQISLNSPPLSLTQEVPDVVL